MLNAVLNWQTYFAINASILLGFSVLRPLLQLPVIKRRLSQQQLLQLTRRLLASILLVFVCMPVIMNLKPLQATLDINPIIIYAPDFINAQYPSVDAASDISNQIAAEIPWKLLLCSLLLTGLVFHLAKYILNLRHLNAIAKESYLLRKIGRVTLIVSEQADSVFCYTLCWQHYVVVPYASLAQTNDLYLSIKHEIQHLRQRDTYWLHFFSLLKVFCFWNPAVKLWINWCKEAQEYACDEAMVLNAKNSLSDYAQCLVNAARNLTTARLDVLAMNGGSTSNLNRRVNMLFNYKPIKRKLFNALIYGVSMIGITGSAYAVNSLSTPLSAHDVAALIKPAYANTLHIAAEPEVVNELNRIRSNPTARDNMRSALQRMEQYKPVIQAEMNNKHVPYDFFAMPIVQSNFKPLLESQNRVQAAGIWQIIPSTAKNLGLTISANRDDRLNTQLSTRAALSYLQSLYKQFNDWKLAALAYEIGEKQTALLIKEMNTRNAWEIARSDYFTKTTQQEVAYYLAKFDATVIILHNPAIIAS